MNRAIVGLVAALASITVLHKGRTDANGGHYNHSTGEYHYHHGYSAHDHYDMDGDGIVDCPYDFKDNTSHKGNTSNKNNTSNNSNTSKSERETNKAPESSDNSAKEPKIKDALSIIIVVVGCLYLANALVTMLRKK